MASASPLLQLWGALALLLLMPAGAARPDPAAPSNGSSSAAPSVNVTLAAVLPGRDLRHPEAWPRVAPALSLALETLAPDLLLAGLSVRTVFAAADDEEGACSNDVAVLKAVELKVAHDPDLLLDPGCDSQNWMARSWEEEWGLPVLSAGDVDDAGGSPTTVYAGPMGPELRTSLELLHRHFNWTSSPVFAFSRTIEPFQRYLYMLFTEELWLESDPPIFYGIDEEPDEALQFIRAHGRVVYISGTLEACQELIHLAQAQNMTNGDYVFIYLDILGESLEADGHREAAKPWQSKESPDAGGLREAFQTVLLVTSREPQTPAYQRFQRELILRAQSDFGVALNDSMRMNLVAGCYHDALLLYIRALNETLREGGTKRDTSRILEKMRDLKIEGVTGRVSITTHNQREADFDLWSMADVERGEYQVVGHSLGSEKQFKWLGPIHWKKGAPPLDRPPCDMDDPSCGEASQEL